ncbi:MAG: tRNA lysidine(34) synthetase TilS [Chitinophagales bacterium]
MQKETLIEKFKEFILEKKLLKKDEPVLLAFSGGIDSMVMTQLFHLCEYKFGIAHCNFQLRGSESDGDEAFAAHIAAHYNIPFYSMRFNTKKHQIENKLSLEEAARNLRYSWLEETRKTFHYAYIATAHHLNDSIETILLNLTKGTGIRGLQGIPSKNQNIIRPLLFSEKEEIKQFCEEHKLTYRTDTTNQSDDFQRNKIRNHVIPVLKEINPALEQTFAKNIRHFTQTNAIFREAADKKIKKIVQHRKDATYIPINTLKNLLASATYLFEILNKFGFNEYQSVEIHENLSGSGKQFFSNTHRVIIDRNFLIVTSLHSEESKHIIIESGNTIIKTKYFNLHFEYSNFHPGMQFNPSGEIAYFDADKISFPLTLRVWKKGDYMYPFGLYKKNSTEKTKKPAKKKISDLLTDIKIDLYEKENTFVLLEGDRICWLLKHRQDERFRLSPTTRKLLKIKMLPGKESI